MSNIQKKKNGFILCTQIIDNPIQLKSKKQINEKKKVRIAIDNKLGPVRHTQQIQANTHKYILEMGSVLEDKYFEPKHQQFNQIFKRKTDIIMEKINYQLEKDTEFIRSEYNKKLLEVTKDHMNKFNEAISAITKDLTNKCEVKQEEYKIDAKNKMFRSIEKSLKLRENFIKQEFGYFKEQNLADFKDYYRRLILFYRLNFEKRLADMEKKHNTKYETMKQSFVHQYKKKIDLEKKKLEEKLLLEKLNLLSVSEVEKVSESEPF
ncbi:uncharacterized protein LOC114121803 [Aphis gossypii]|uniref:uncharacterized protein LOC114121803 n=1 Tax=Aphis gossypii TaxID=80765 RepID=UPI0021592FAA|nr:uncharacterized protein LOC114121803 [Aphis gossypii]